MEGSDTRSLYLLNHSGGVTEPAIDAGVVLYNAPDACLVVDDDVEVIYANQAGCALLSLVGVYREARDNRAGSIPTALPEVARAVFLNQAPRVISLASPAGERRFYMRSAPLEQGSAFYLRDVTEEYRIAGEFEQRLTTIRAQRAEIELMSVELEHARGQLASGMLGDGATGIGSPAAFVDRLDLEFHRSERYRTALSLLLVKPDPTPGNIHTLERSLTTVELRDLSDIMARSCRNTDLASRCDDSTFALILPETRGQDALIVAKRVLLAVRARQESLTVSIGVASMSQAIESGSGLISHAELALSASVRLGGDRVTHYNELRDPRSDAWDGGQG